MVYLASGDPGRSVALLWDVEPPASRGPRAGITKREAVEAAVSMADERGLASVSMRALAGRLGVTAMSLYPRVGTKADLLDLMLDRLIGELVDSDGPRVLDWRSGLAHSAEQAWALYRRHPWALEIASGRSPLGPSELAYFEQQLSLFDELALPAGLTERIIGVVGNYVRGSARAVSELHDAAAVTGVSDDEHWQRRAAALRRVMDLPTRQRFPRLHAMGALDAFIEGRPIPAVDETHLQVAEESFLFGLERLLDGIALEVAAVAG